MIKTCQNLAKYLPKLMTKVAELFCPNYEQGCRSYMAEIRSKF